MEIQTRKEFDLIPQGVSSTETEASVYLRYRKDDTIATLRVPKDDFYKSVMSIDQVVEVNPTKWHGVWGTNG